jgi:hypothetical protein
VVFIDKLNYKQECSLGDKCQKQNENERRTKRKSERRAENKKKLNQIL